VSFYICIPVVFKFSGPSFYTTYVYIPSILFSWVPIRNIINRHPSYLPIIYLSVSLSHRRVFLLLFFLSKEFQQCNRNIFTPSLQSPIIYTNEFWMNFVSGPRDIFPKRQICERLGGSDTEKQIGENSQKKIKHNCTCIILRSLVRGVDSVEFILHDFLSTRNLQCLIIFLIYSTHLFREYLCRLLFRCFSTI